MGPRSAELAEEQAYFDLAHNHRERKKSRAADAVDAAAHPGVAMRLRDWAKRRVDSTGAADDPVAIGRIDDESHQTLYVGRETIVDDKRDVLVVNWKADAAAPFYQATHADPRGLVRKRTFECSGNEIRDFSDLVFADLAAAVADLESADRPALPGELLDPQLLGELDKARTGAMRDIVATIHAAQYELISAPLDQMMIIEGGPGTGKTAVALHRVSWLLFNHADRVTPADVLVVGPHPAFTRYIGTVLPALGDASVEQRDIGQLAPPVRRGRAEAAEVRRIKGEARMASLLARALDNRVGTPEPAERLLLDGRFVTLSATEISTIVAECRESSAPYSQRRQLLRTRLLDLVRERGVNVERDRVVPVENLVERLWPRLSATAFLRDLLGSRARLTAAGGTEFTLDEVLALHRRGADRLSAEVWTTADLPLLDEAEELLNGIPRRYAHIVVDEAQDLSPMQLRSIARRSSTGSLTVVGDLAQSTGAWARDRWDEVTRHLPDRLPQRVVALRYGYRVPRQVYDFAARLLPVAAPGVAPAQVVRDGPAEPAIHRVNADERADRAAAVAMEHAAAGRFVGVICPPARRAEVEGALAANAVTWSSAERGELTTAINLVSPQEAKGLEFDAVVVLEPEEIVAGDERGHRLLYVALTRTTRYLDVVCVGEPLPSAVPPGPAEIGPAEIGPAEIGPAEIGPAQIGPAATGPAGMDSGAIDRLAAEVAALVTGGVPAPLWDEVLQRAAEVLDRQGQRNRPSGRHRRD